MDLFHPLDDDFLFAVRYRCQSVQQGAVWLDYSLHPPSKLGLHNALLAQHDRIDILRERGEVFECRVFVKRHGHMEPLSQDGAERLFRDLPAGEVKWVELCRCLLPPVAAPAPAPAPAAPLPPAGSGGNAADRAGSAEGQMPLFPHVHTLYDDAEALGEHDLDCSA